MGIKAKVVLIIITVALLWGFTTALSAYPGFVLFYNHHIYSPLQSFRVIVFGSIPFSIGDVLYFSGGLWLLITLINWVTHIRNFSTRKDKFVGSILNTIAVGLFVYLLFLLGWGANYYKAPLAENWGLTQVAETNKAVRRARDSAAVVAFNKFLVKKLNAYALLYSTLPYDQIHDKAITYYRNYTDSRVKQNGLGVKATLYGFFMQRMGVDGYYNPFTGEGQVSKRIPTFVMPFTVCHEMAHQAGIAPEGDANLLAYAIGTTTSDPVFQYSAYLNLWLYANNRLFRYDSTTARQFYKLLNPLTVSHLDTLEQLSNKYHGLSSQYTAYIYDSYLRSQNQKQGISSYSNVTKEAWLLEEIRRNGKVMIHLP